MMLQANCTTFQTQTNLESYRNVHSIVIVRERCLMTDILEHKGNLRQPNLCTEQIVMVVLEFAIREVIPPEIS